MEKINRRNNSEFIGKIVVTKTYNESLQSKISRSKLNSRRRLPLEINCYYNNKKDQAEFIENQYDQVFYSTPFFHSTYMQLSHVQNQYFNLLKVIKREKLLTKLLDGK